MPSVYHFISDLHIGGDEALGVCDFEDELIASLEALASQGEDAELIEWEPGNLDHNETGFPLTGFHGRIQDCRQCHSPPRAISKRPTRTYLLEDSQCIACHQDGHEAHLGNDCSACHAFDIRFGETQFDHRSTRFSLTGAHVNVFCNDCHRSLPAGVSEMSLTESDRCSMCHRSAHSNRLNDCTQCHTSEEWRVRAW